MDDRVITGGMNDDEIRAVLIDTVQRRLMRQAGYVPGQLLESPEKTRLRGYVHPAHCDSDLWQVWQWVHGRGWIAGSAALWAYSVERNPEFTQWHYNDIDVFAFDDKAYESLKAELHDDTFGFDVETEYSVKMGNPLLKIGGESAYISTDVNIIRPPEGVKWFNHCLLWESFDLNAAQCTLIAPQWVSIVGNLNTVSFGDDTNSSRPPLWPSFGIKHAGIFIERVQKYVERGFRLPADFWIEVLDKASAKSSTLRGEYISLISFLNVVRKSDLKKLKMYTGEALDSLVDSPPDSYQYEEYDYDDYWRFS